MIIEATNIHKSFGSLEVLKGIDLTVAPREIISIVGASGAGKTTLPALIAGESRSKVRERALGLLERLGLAERASHKPAELSGGESQRIAVARALINSPAVIFADEPSGSLDTANKQSLHQLFFDLRDELGQTFVIVTHDEALAAQADRMIVLRDGRIEAIHTRTEAPTEEHVG